MQSSGDVGVHLEGLWNAKGRAFVSFVGHGLISQYKQLRQRTQLQHRYSQAQLKHSSIVQVYSSA